MRARTEALIIAGFAVAAVASAIVPVLAPTRPVLAPPLALVLPGLAVVRLPPFRDVQGLAVPVLAVCLSLAISVLAGLALAALGALDARGWSIALGGFVLALCFARSCARAGLATGRSDWLPTPVQAAFFVAAFAVAGGGIALARQGALAQHEFAFTEFWMTPRQPSEQNIVTLGVRNQERATTSYGVAIVAGSSVIARWPPFSLEPGETWTNDLSLNSELRKSPRVEAWLYRAQAPQVVYRKVWISAPPQPKDRQD